MDYSTLIILVVIILVLWLGFKSNTHVSDKNRFIDYSITKLKSTPYNGKDPRLLEFLVMATKYSSVYHKKTRTGSPRVYIGLVDNPTLNACAYVYRGGEGIALMTGCVGVLDYFFNRVLSHPQTFLSIGRPGLEVAHPRMPLTYTKSSSSRVPIPVDEQRRTTAKRLSDFALATLIVHELAHFMLGHNRLRKTNSFITTERKEVDGSSRLVCDDILEAQALEMNADATAINEGIHLITALADNMPNSTEALQVLFSQWLYAISAMFRLFALGIPFHLDKLAAKEHPPAQVRFMWTLQIVIPLAEQGLFRLNASEVRRIAAITVDQLERDISKITGQPIDWAGQALLIHKNVDDHLGLLKRKYDQLEPRLIKVRYIDLDVQN